MTEHTPVPYGYFKSQESRFFQAEKWAITGPDHDHEESWDIVADGIPDEDTARFIVTACNCHADLLEALKDTREALLAWETECPDSWDAGDVRAVKKADEAIRKAQESAK